MIVNTHYIFIHIFYLKTKTYIYNNIMLNKSNNLNSTTQHDEDNKTLKMVANPWNKKEHERVKKGEEEDILETEV